MKLWYLGSPYSRYRYGPEAAYERISHQAAVLLREGVNAFSPIAHSHSLATHGGLDPVDHDYWMAKDRPYMEKCDGLIVCEMEGWQESRGLAHEIEFFSSAGKPVIHMTFMGRVPSELKEPA
jgi:nucleoside 2-deoxyribosyltransferase